MTFRRTVAAPVLALVVSLPAVAFPATVENCFETETFDAPPERPIVNDTNMVQTFIDLGLADRLVGVSGNDGVEWAIEAEPGVVEALPQFSERYPTLEAILGQNPDFMFAGWMYGFNEAQGITPQALRDFGIRTYTMRESCIRIGAREPISMETLYVDIISLGRIFGIENVTRPMVEDWRARVAAVEAAVAGVTERPRVMYCGNCSTEDAPLSIGGEGMPRLLAELAGGENIFNDIPDSYVRVSWEDVVARNPEWILVSDHRVSAEESIAHLKRDPQLRDVTAVREERFITVTYPQRSPSTRNIETLERIARTLHPDRFE